MNKCRREIPIAGRTFLKTLTVLAYLSISSTSSQALAQNQNQGWDAQQTLDDKSFVHPPNDISEAVLAPRYLNMTLSNISADKHWFFHEISDGPVTMDRFSRDFDELGWQFFDYSANRHRNLTIRSNVGIDVVSASDGSRTSIQTPNGSRISNVKFSPDGSTLAFFVHTASETHIYAGDPETGTSRKITDIAVLGNLVTDFEWTGDGKEIATVVIPSGRSTRPVPSTVPTGPQVKHTQDGENMLRTYASLMATPHDEELLEWHATGQLVTINVETGNTENIGSPAMIYGFDFAPNGQYSRVELLEKPFSYIVPVNNFGRVEQIWGRNGNMLADLEKTEMNTGLGDRRPSAPGVAGSGDALQKRQIRWKEDSSGLTYVQAESHTDEKEENNDRVMVWTPPFEDSNISVLYETDSSVSSHGFSNDYGTLFVTETSGSEDDQGQITHRAIDLSDSGQTFVLAQYDSDDFYSNPGTLLMDGGQVPVVNRRRGSPTGGTGVVQTSMDGQSVFFYGHEYNADPMQEGPKNFLDKVAIRTGEKERIYESNNQESYERIVSVIDIDDEEFVVSRETPTETPQSHLLVDGRRTQLTDNVDYTPDLTHAPKRRFVVERPDGFKFMVNVLLPSNYNPGTRLPAMFWFYPREYEDQESYDEAGRTYNKNAFPNFGTRSIQYMTRMGYAVVEPDAPIVGKPGQMNNNYEHDLRNNLAAVIDELDEREIIDRKRLGLGGHSYGAFGTVNAMVHTPFFKAGIAGDGNYNRTFTPLSFQSERRIFWDAKEVYLGMSPFVYANNLTGALLMYHGMHDQNVGTAPDHSPRLFHALNGLGKKAAMYLYPFEDHGPATKETLLDLWGRWAAWLDVHLKGTEEEERRITSDDHQWRD